jgi:hypothetical protein
VTPDDLAAPLASDKHGGFSPSCQQAATFRAEFILILNRLAALRALAPDDVISAIFAIAPSAAADVNWLNVAAPCARETFPATAKFVHLYRRTG